MVIQDMKAQMNLIEKTLQRLTETTEPIGRHRVMNEAIEQMEMLRADLHLAQNEKPTVEELLERLYEYLHVRHFEPATREDIMRSVDTLLRNVHRPSDEMKAHTMQYLLDDLEKMLNPTLVRDFLKQLPNILDNLGEQRNGNACF